MCFSAEASFGAAVALLPAGAYCVEAAWRKNRTYLALSVVPLVFGVQQLCEAAVWMGVVRDDVGMSRVASLAYLFFALAVWPVWIPLAVAAIEPTKWKRLALALLGGLGVLFGIASYLPLAMAGGAGINPSVVGHSIRYDLSNVPAMQSAGWWEWMAVYVAVISGPLLLPRTPQLRLIGVAVVLLALVSYLLFEYAFASVWCFFAAILSLFLVRIHSMIPDPRASIVEPRLQPSPSN